MNPLPPLPRHWSAEQAMAVYEFLQLLSEQLWCHYRADFVALLGERAVQVLQPAKPEHAFDPHQLGFTFEGFDDPDDEHDLPF